MKYQVYLNKETSAFINKLAETKGKKPNTCIKELMEAFALMSKPLESQILKEVSNGERK